MEVMSEHEIKEKLQLLGPDGCLTEPGWARRPYFSYDRKKIRANKLRIKEWDYYSILNPEKGYSICITYSDLGYAGLYAVAFIDYKRGAAQTDFIRPLTLHRTGLGFNSLESSELSVSNEDKFTFTIITRYEKVFITISAPYLVLPDGTTGLWAEVELSRPISQESLNIATSWKENRRAFYLNEKVCGLAVSKSWIRHGEVKEDAAEDYCSAILDWGRGRWTRINRWYWAAASGYQDGCSMALNLGYGFSDRSVASENAFFLGGRLHKIGKCEWVIPDGYMTGDWIMKSDDGRLDLIFRPAVMRESHTNLAIIRSDQQQVFGYFSGTVLLEDGRPLKLDGLQGFAEDVYNKW